jgi:alkyl hydroperoxide reductase subunit F
VLGDGEKVTGLVYKDRTTGESQRVELEGIFVQIGLLPNTDWLKGTVALSRRGEIVIDAKGQTSVPGVFAAGDCTTVPYKQIVIAMGAGAKASLGAFDYLIRSSPAGGNPRQPPASPGQGGTDARPAARREDRGAGTTRAGKAAGPGTVPG